MIEKIKISPYQEEFLNEIRSMFPELKIEIGRGDRLLVEGYMLRGFLVYEAMKKNHDFNLNIASKEIKIQYSNRLKQ